MSQDTNEKEAKASSLKDLNSRLNEIYNTLDDADTRLEFLAKNIPAEKSTGEQPLTGETATLEGLHHIVDKIGRKSNSIAKSTSIIVGS